MPGQGATRYVGRASKAPITLTSQSAVGTDGNDSAVADLGEFANICWELDVTADESTSADTCDVFVQALFDSNWVDIVHFTQLAGNDGAQTFYEKTCAQLAQAGFESGTSLSAGEVRHLFGDSYRVRWEVLDDSSSAAFTFTVKANLQ